MFPVSRCWPFVSFHNLLDFENHRTSTQYEDALISKLFGFTFCNSYGGFFYLAFVKEPVVGVACESNCMSLLSTNLTIVFVFQIVVGFCTKDVTGALPIWSLFRPIPWLCWKVTYVRVSNKHNGLTPKGLISNWHVVGNFIMCSLRANMEESLHWSINLSEQYQATAWNPPCPVPYPFPFSPPPPLSPLHMYDIVASVLG